MSKSSNGNGNGNGGGVVARPGQQKPPTVTLTIENGSFVTFQTAEGIKLKGMVSRVTRHMVVFELYSHSVTPLSSEALGHFTLTMDSREVYSGRAVISKIVDVGTKIICEATLEVMDWQDLNLVLALQNRQQIEKEFKNFLLEWQKFYRVSPEFKILVADMQTFFTDMRLLLDRMEIKLQSFSLRDKPRAEQEILDQLAKVFLPLIDAFFEKFEGIAGFIKESEKAFHANYIRRLLHPLVLTAPFANRTFSKPRGYAGDYEMVNMIGRNSYEGGSLFAKILHLWFVKQPPAEAHRNRVKYLAEVIEMESCRLARENRLVRVYNFACGPAIEMQTFLQKSSMAENVEFTLADFDEETLGHTRSLLSSIINQRKLDTLVSFEKKPVHSLVKDRAKLMAGKKYDLVYCAGLFDYLPDTTCKQLMDIFYDMVAPGGLLLATNVSSGNPSTQTMEHVLDWHLIYRSEKDMRILSPTSTKKEDNRIHADSTGVNLFLEIRKLKDA